MMRHTKQKAFTLVELMVVIAIIGVTAAIVIVNLMDARVNRQVVSASQHIASVIRASQNDALTGRASGQAEKNSYFGVEFTAPNQYAVVSFDTAGSKTIRATHQLSHGVTLTDPGHNVIAFALPRGEVYSGNDAADMGSVPSSHSSVFTLTLRKQGKVASVCVYASGRIEESGVGNNCP